MRAPVGFKIYWRSPDSAELDEIDDTLTGVDLPPGNQGVIMLIRRLAEAERAAIDWKTQAIHMRKRAEAAEGELRSIQDQRARSAVRVDPSAPTPLADAAWKSAGLDLATTQRAPVYDPELTPADGTEAET